MDKDIEMEELVSVIMPVYNTSKYLDKSVESVIKQTYGNLQIILVDDGATDISPMMCDEWEKRDARIEVIHKQNEGLGYTRNVGLEAAIGKYVCFLDSDDTLDINTIELCVKTLEMNQADACFYPRKTFDRNGIFKINMSIPTKLEFVGDEVRNEFAKIYFGQLPYEKGEPFLHPSVCRGMFLRETIERNNLRFLSERECLSEDVFFGLDFCKVAQKVIIIPKYLYNYTYNQTSLTKSYNPHKLQLFKNLYYRLLKYSVEYKEIDGVQLRIQHKFISGVQWCIEMEVQTRKMRGWRQTYQHVKEICSDIDVREILGNCPLDQVMKKRRYFIKLVLKKRVFILCSLYSLK